MVSKKQKEKAALREEADQIRRTKMMEQKLRRESVGKKLAMMGKQGKDVGSGPKKGDCQFYAIMDGVQQNLNTLVNELGMIDSEICPEGTNLTPDDLRLEVVEWLILHREEAMSSSDDKTLKDLARDEFECDTFDEFLGKDRKSVV